MVVPGNLVTLWIEPKLLDELVLRAKAGAGRGDPVLDVHTDGDGEQEERRLEEDGAWEIGAWRLSVGAARGTAGGGC